MTFLQRVGLAFCFIFALGLSAAQAHTGVGSVHGFFSGLAHPLGGLDHLCAMLAVGLWAGQLGGRAFWLVPSAFVAALGVGGMLGMQGVPFPYVEQGIAASVVVVGLLVAISCRLPLAAGMVLVAGFALFHGYAHGAEMPVAASGWNYGAGFMLATALLHGLGLITSVLLQRVAQAQVIRWMGGFVGCLGIYLLLA